MPDLTAQKAIVTGAAGVLGAAVARECEAQGARTVLIDVAAGFARGPGERLEIDLTDAAALAEAMANVGDFDVVCNIAGGFDNEQAQHLGMSKAAPHRELGDPVDIVSPEVDANRRGGR